MMKKTMPKGHVPGHVPEPQTMGMTQKDSREAKTARPAMGRKMDTPRVKNAPPAPERKKAPKY